MNLLFQAGFDLQTFLSSSKLEFCFIGGLAILRWGEIRMTQDVDVTVYIPFGQEDAFSTKILNQYVSRISEPIDFAIKNRVLLINTSNGIPADISIAGFTFEEEIISRASEFEFFPGLSLKTCSAEDLIVLKAFANRAKDWSDIEGVFFRQKGTLDHDLIIQQLRPLCELKEDMSILDRINQTIARVAP